MDFDEAKHLLDREFRARHPRESWPAWLEELITVGGYRVAERWIMACTLSYAQPLAPGESWDTVGKHRVVTRIDSTTGKKQVVIHRPNLKPPLVIFQVEINSNNGQLNVEIDANLESLREQDFRE